MVLKGFYALMGVSSLANAIWMFVGAESWYEHLPAGVPDTGPYNEHFIRDIGLAYAITGFGFLWCARNLATCRVVHVGLTLFVTGHAVLHVVDIIRGRLPMDHWLIDAPLVLLPGLIMLLLTFPRVWLWANPQRTAA